MSLHPARAILGCPPGAQGTQGSTRRFRSSNGDRPPRAKLAIGTRRLLAHAMGAYASWSSAQGIPAMRRCGWIQATLGQYSGFKCVIQLDRSWVHWVKAKILPHTVCSPSVHRCSCPSTPINGRAHSYEVASAVTFLTPGLTACVVASSASCARDRCPMRATAGTHFPLATLFIPKTNGVDCFHVNAVGQWTKN